MNGKDESVRARYLEESGRGNKYEMTGLPSSWCLRELETYHSFDNLERLYSDRQTSATSFTKHISESVLYCRYSGTKEKHNLVEAEGHF